LHRDDKPAIAAEIAARPARTLFFVRTKHGADRLAKQIVKQGTDAVAIHGNLSQGQRQRALEGFTSGRSRVLVATNVAARGIHVDDLDLVVHYDPPNDHKDYLHRSGRTARAGASGTVVSLVETHQARDTARMHAAAAVSPRVTSVQSGHRAIRQLAESGEPIVPGPAPVPSEGRGQRPARTEGRSRRPASARMRGRGPAPARARRVRSTDGF
jgi:superfamily II DNA/RNA helicase